MGRTDSGRALVRELPVPAFGADPDCWWRFSRIQAPKLEQSRVVCGGAECGGLGCGGYETHGLVGRGPSKRTRTEA